MDKEVYTSKDFQDYASKNLVLVRVDFPSKIQQSAQLKKANESLKAQYKVNGFPTMVVLDADGKLLGTKVGYPPGSGPKPVIAAIEGFKSKR